jgi:hypothetical protein
VALLRAPEVVIFFTGFKGRKISTRFWVFPLFYRSGGWGLSLFSKPVGKFQRSNDILFPTG